MLSIVSRTARHIVSDEFTLTDDSFPQRLLEDDPGAPYFGVEPTFHEGLNALRLEQVPKGSPAAKAGLKSGDILLELGEFPIRTLSDFKETLQNFLPGDMPAVVVRRQGRSLRVAVALESETN